MGYGLWVMGYVMGYGLWVMGCELWVNSCQNKD